MRKCIYQSDHIPCGVGVGEYWPLQDAGSYPEYVPRKLGVFICENCSKPNFRVGICWIIDGDSILKMQDPERWEKKHEDDNDWYRSDPDS